MNLASADRQLDSVRYRVPEIEHRYGDGVHILSSPYLLTLLAQLCSAQTEQPTINHLVTTLYSSLLDTVASAELPLRRVAIPTRMSASHPEGVYCGPAVDPETPVVCVNLARAGTLPSHVCYSALNALMNPRRVRQDHVSIARATDASEKVTGCPTVTGAKVSGHKLGGPVDGAVLLFPDPMGATGHTIVEALNLYRGLGKPLRAVAIHCIVTPEYIKRVRSAHPELVIYAIRLDRGLSPRDVLDTVPGTHWAREKGLNEKQYIVPGGGGFGEVMNNAYV